MKVIKRRTPIDDPKTLEEAKQLHNYYTKELGLSNRRSFTLLGEKYGYSRTGIQYWIEENVRRRSIQRKKDTLVPYSKHPRVEERRRHSRTYMHMYRRPDIYLKEVYSNPDSPLSLDDITLSLHQKHGILLRNKTLINIVDQYGQRTGRKLLSPTDEVPPRYYLRS